MIVAIADVYAQIPQRDAAEQVMVRAQTAARGEDGCVAFAFAQYQSAITPLLVRDSELRVDTVQETVLPLDSSPLDIRHDD